MSYICFLGLTWWIWASQVLYNVRYRQKDWLHHVFVILQLLTFCALAAFAGGFDISQGIIPDDDNALIDQFASSQQSFINGDLATENARSDFLSRVNSTGISIVLAFSRLVILVQYLRGTRFFRSSSVNVHGANPRYALRQHGAARDSQMRKNLLVPRNCTLFL